MKFTAIWLPWRLETGKVGSFMPELPEIPDASIGGEDEEVELLRERGCHAKKCKKRREGSFIPQKALEALYPRFPGNATAKVFFLILTVAAKYGKDVAYLSLDEIATASGLSKRTAEYAVSRLKGDGLIRREGRYRITVVDLSRETLGTVDSPKTASRLRFPKPQSCVSKTARLRSKTASYRRS
jgi:hypothetical protein